MNQLFETQLQVVQRALGDVVAPSLGDVESYVVEQLQLAMAALAFMQQRLPHARRYYRGTLSSYISMAQAIVGLLAEFAKPSGDLEALIAMGRALLDNPEAELCDYRELTEELRTCVAAMATAAQDEPHETALDALILDRSGPILLQDRIWCLPMGFELRPDDLPKPDWER